MKKLKSRERLSKQIKQVAKLIRQADKIQDEASSNKFRELREFLRNKQQKVST